jgi:hypothetical protein
MTRSAVFVAEVLKHSIKDMGEKSFVLQPVDTSVMLLKLSFWSHLEMHKALDAIRVFFEIAKSLDKLKLSEAAAADRLNMQLSPVVTLEFVEYGPKCLNCCSGECVVISERRGSWVVATTIDRKLNSSGWVPRAILANTCFHASENKVTISRFFF